MLVLDVLLYKKCMTSNTATNKATLAQQESKTLGKLKKAIEQELLQTPAKTLAELEAPGPSMASDAAARQSEQQLK